MVKLPRPALRRHLVALAPGLLLALAVALAARFLGMHYGAPVMLFALLIGMAFNFLDEDPRFAAGLALASKAMLRAGIVLLGLRITLGDMADVGLPAFATVLGLVAATIGAGVGLARLCGQDWRFGVLTGGAVAICGASAALALAAVLSTDRAGGRNTLFTVVAVTTLSTVAMVGYPLLFAALGLSDRQIGFLVGATIHDVAQVIGAGYSVSVPAGDLATIVKLVRVALLPVVLVAVTLAVATRPGGSGRPRGLPVFVTGFMALSGLNSLGLVPASVAAAGVTLSGFLLVVAIAALGVRTNLRDMVRLGWRHAVVVVGETVLLLGLALAAVGVGLAAA